MKDKNRKAAVKDDGTAGRRRGDAGKPRGGKKFPRVSLTVLLIITGACALAGLIAPYSPELMDPQSVNQAPGAAHLLGTDAMGRDLLTVILYGGRASVYIGILSAAISTAVAVVYGTLSGLSGKLADDVLMRFSELMMSVPSILLIIFLQAIWGEATATSLAVIIGLTSWTNVSKIVRSEVRRIAASDFVLAARTMGGGFWYVLARHLLPGFVSPIMFMVVTNIGQAMITESTLSFLGLGLPLSTTSWGSLLSMSREAMLSNCWWLTVAPGAVLIATLVCVTELGEYVRKSNNRLYSNL